MVQIQFKGKVFVQNHHLLVKYHELVPVKEKSLTNKVSLKDNLIIHGDNLNALKALLPLYAGKIKCIYIDPPYNTGNENWTYNDNVSSPMMQEWLGKVVDREDLTRHDKWLCMMMPRLKLLKELLREDGVIFISIDENEQHHLTVLLNEVFGEASHLASFVWAARGGRGGTTAQVEMMHEYVASYAVCPQAAQLKPIVSKAEEGNYRDRKGSYRRELLRQWGQGDKREDRPHLYFPVLSPSGEEIYPRRADGCDGRWRFGEQRVNQMLDEGDLDFVQNGQGDWIVYRKIREGRESVTAAVSLLLDYGTASNATIELKRIFGEKVFPSAKPTALIRHLVESVCWKDKEAIVLDSFAGSGTTGHAVLSLNKEDGGTRRFILVECEDYADRITAERVRRVIRGVPGARDEALRQGLGGTFSYFELGKAIELESILSGENLPPYDDLARYVFYTATGEEFDEAAVDRRTGFIGEGRNYQVYLFYEEDLARLKNLAFTLDMARSLPSLKEGKRRLVFAPTKYLDQQFLDEFRIDFAQLPFEIYQLAK